MKQKLIAKNLATTSPYLARAMASISHATLVATTGKHNLARPPLTWTKALIGPLARKADQGQLIWLWSNLILSRNDSRVPKSKTRRLKSRTNLAITVQPLTTRHPHLRISLPQCARCRATTKDRHSMGTKERLLPSQPKSYSEVIATSSNYNKKWLNHQLRARLSPRPQSKRQSSRAQPHPKTSKGPLRMAFARQGWAMAAILRVLIWSKLDSMWSTVNWSIQDSPSDQSNPSTPVKKWSMNKKLR